MGNTLSVMAHIVVIDFTGCENTVQAGFATEDAPRYTYTLDDELVSNAMGVTQLDPTDTTRVMGTDAMYFKTLTPPFDFDLSECLPGHQSTFWVSSWDGLEELLRRVFSDLGVDSKDCMVLFTEILSPREAFLHKVD